MNPWVICAELGVTVGLWALNSWLNSPPDTRAQYLQDAPTATEGTPVNIVVGMQRVRNSTLAWYGGFQNRGPLSWGGWYGGISQPDGTVNYGLNMLYLLGLPMGPPSPAASVDAALTAMYVGDSYLSFTQGGIVHAFTQAPALCFVATGTGGGSLYVSSAEAVFYFQDGVTKCSDFENAVASAGGALTIITPSTNPNQVLTAASDQFSFAAFAGPPYSLNLGSVTVHDNAVLGAFVSLGGGSVANAIKSGDGIKTSGLASPGSGELNNNLNIIGYVSFFNGGTDQRISNNNPATSSIENTYDDVTDLGWFIRRAAFENRGGIDPSLIPGYRGQMIVGLTGKHDWLTGLSDGLPQFWDACYVGPDPHVPAISWEVACYRNYYTGQWSTWQDADPASVITDILTNTWGRVGLDLSQIDGNSFLSSSLTLLAEGNGYSRVIDTLRSAKDVIQEIANQTCGVVYMDPVDGKVHYRLFRNDYNPATILQLVKGDVRSIEENTVGSWRNTQNQVRVKYNDRTLGYVDATAVAQNMASAVMQASTNTTNPGGNVRSVSVSYPGCCTLTLAQQLAQRDLSLLSVPLQQLRATFTRKAAVLRPGDVFKLTLADYPSLAGGVVFRVTSVDLGQIGDGKVSIVAMQDLFSVGQGAAYPQPPTSVSTIDIPLPSPLTDTLVTEAPRWLVQWGVNGGVFPNASNPYLMMLATPDDGSASYVGNSAATLLLIEGFQKLSSDLASTAYASHGYVHTAYDRSLGPYDLTTGLVVDSLPLSFAAAQVTESWSHDNIETTGYPLVLVGGNEIMGYESVTDLSGVGTGPWRLNNVWRALLDTAAHDHVVGEDVYWIGTAFNSNNWIGRTSHANFSLNTVQLQPRLGLLLGSGADTSSAYSVQKRAMLSPRVAYLRLCGEVMSGTALQPDDGTQPSGMTGYYGKVTAAEEGLGVQWNTRDRLSSNVIRGDEASETPSDAVTYTVTATKVAAQAGEAAGTEQAISSALTTSNPSAQLLVGAAGYGDIDVGVHTATTSLAKNEWDQPKIRCRFERWRSLLGNARFLINGAGTNPAPCWGGSSPTIVAGTASIYNAAGGLYCASTVNGGNVVQTFNVAGYLPRGMDAWLEFYAISLSLTDKVVAKIEALDSGGTSLANTSATVTPTASTTWAVQDLVLSALPTSTAQIRVTFTFGGLGTAPTCYVCEPRLRIGTFNRNVLTNPSFESGLATGWTVDAGGMNQTTTTNARPSAHYASGSTFVAGTSTIHQDYTLPTGWEVGSDAVLTCWRYNYSGADQAKVTLKALDALSSTLVSVDTGFEATSTWVQRRLSFQVPEGTVKIRVQFDGVDPGGGVVGKYALDDVRLSLAKDLGDPRYYKSFLFNAPSAQPIGSTWQAWHRSYTSLYAAGVAHPIVFQGGSVAGSIDSITSRAVQLGYSNIIGIGNAIGVGVGMWGSGVASVPTWQFTRGGPYILSVNESVSTRRLAPRTADDFTFAAWIRVDEDTFGGACGIAGRRDGSAGWGLTLDGSGQLQCTLTGTLGTVSVTRTGSVLADGAWHMVALIYDPVAHTLTAQDERGHTSTSTSAIGEIYNASASTPFMIGRSTSLDATLPGMFAWGYWWDQTLSTAHVAAHWSYGKDPSGLLSGVNRADAAWVPGCLDASGNETIALVAYDQVAVGYSPALSILDSVSPMGLATSAGSNTNLVTGFDFSDALGPATSWAIEAGVVLSTGVVDASGRALGANVNGTATNGLKALALAVGAGTTLCVVFWARSATSGSVTTTLLNGLDVQKGSNVAFALGPTWQRCVAQFTGWDNSTPANARIAFRSSAAFDISHVVDVQMGTDCPALIPRLPNAALASDVTGYFNAPSNSMPLQYNAEGELFVSGVGAGVGTPPQSTIVSVDDGGLTNKNTREVMVDASAKARFDHYDSTPAVNTSLTGSAETWGQAFQIRGRWCYTGTLDNASTPFAGIRATFGVSTQSTYGRSAGWTYDTTRMARMEIGAGLHSAFSGFIREVRIRAREEKLS